MRGRPGLGEQLVSFVMMNCLELSMGQPSGDVHSAVGCVGLNEDRRPIEMGERDLKLLAETIGDNLKP